MPSLPPYNNNTSPSEEKVRSITIPKISLPKPIRELNYIKPSTAENSLMKNQVTQSYSFNFNKTYKETSYPVISRMKKEEPETKEVRRSFKDISIFVPEDGYSKVSAQKKNANQELSNLNRVHKLLIKVFYNERIDDVYFDLKPYEIQIILEFIMRKDKTVIWDR